MVKTKSLFPNQQPTVYPVSVKHWPLGKNNIINDNKRSVLSGMLRFFS